MITPNAKAWLLLTALTICCLMGQACAPVGPADPTDGSPTDPPVGTNDADEELAEAFGGSLDDVTEEQEAEAEADLAALSEASDELDSLLATMGDEEAAKTEMVSRLLSDPDVEWAQSTYFGVAMKYADGTETGIVLDWGDGEPPGMVDGGGDDLDGSDLQTAKATLTLKSANLVASNKTILLNPHYWERDQYMDDLVSTANARFHECGLDYPVVYKGEQCRIVKFMRLSDYGVVHIYSHGLAWPNKHEPQRVYLMTGHIATKGNLAFLKSKNLVPHKVAYFWTPFGDENTKKPIYVISADFIAENNDFSASKSLVYLGFCHSYRAGFQNTIVTAGNAQAALGVNWTVSTKKNVEWAKSMYNAMGDTSRDEPVDLRTWYYSDNHQYTRTDKDASGDTITVTVRLRGKGNGDTILWEEPEEMDPCLERAIRQQLGLADAAELTSADLAEVTSLEASNVGIRTLTGIGGCVNLETLNVPSNEIVDLAPLAELTKLKNLSLVDNKIQDVSPLSSITSLESLVLTHNFIGSIASLSPLVNLHTLKVGWQQNDAITTLAGVENMTKLTWLGASGNTIDSLAPVAGLTSLQTLNATHNQISDYAGTTGLLNLKTLQLTENPITSLSGLMGATFLATGPSIYVTCCPIDTNCDTEEGSTAECDRKDQLESQGATIIWGDRATCGSEPPLLGIPDVHETCDAQ